MSFTSTLTGGLIADAPDYAAMAKKSEAKRKGIIDLGLRQINALYGGGTAPFYTMANNEGAKFDPKGTYYSQNKQGQFTPYWAPGTKPGGKWTPGVGTMIMQTAPGSPWLGSKIFGKSESPKDIAKKSFRKGLLFNAPTEQTFTGYGDPFFEARRKAYIDYAMPQLGEQYRNARDAQLYAMSNRGLLGSTQASRAASDLTRQTGVAEQTIADEAMNQSNQLRKVVEDARQASIQQLYQTADPAQAMMRALSASQQFERPSAFVPIANMFNNALSQYSMMNQQRKYGAYPQLFSGEPLSNYLAPI